MGAASSSIRDLPENEYLKKLSGREAISENDPFWNQLLSFSFTIPTNRALEPPACTSSRSTSVEAYQGHGGRIYNYPMSRQTGNAQKHPRMMSILELQDSSQVDFCYVLTLTFCGGFDCTNAELKLLDEASVSVCKSLGSEYEDLMEELLCCLIQLIVEIPL
ncbi:hypothetical protein L345_13720, partial [Ophiophagus hannah]